MEIRERFHPKTHEVKYRDEQSRHILTSTTIMNGIRLLQHIQPSLCSKIRRVKVGIIKIIIIHLATFTAICPIVIIRSAAAVKITAE